MERPITGQDLRRHPSGFVYANHASFPALKEADTKAAIEARATDVSPDEMVPQLAAIPRAWQPGTRGPYGVSTDVRGILRERMTGQRLDRLRDERLFTPLPMKDTRFQVQPEQRARLADSTGDAMWAGGGGTRCTIDPQEQIVGVFMAQAPTPRWHTRFLVNNLLYGALVR